jgi:RNA polymerase sigma-70 factor, ECF subfamily
VSRIAMDVLRSARHRRERYVGPWLPEPLVTEDDPAEQLDRHESMSLAVLAVLESLSPAERTAFVLHDVFGLSFDEVGQAVGRSGAACRQLAARARRHLDGRVPRFDVDVAEHRRVLDAFTAAAAGRDLQALLHVLDPDVVLRTDGGGTAKAALRPVFGADKVARFLLGAGVRTEMVAEIRPVLVNGWPGLLHDGPAGLTVTGIVVSDGRITRIDLVRNPAKLRRIG